MTWIVRFLIRHFTIGPARQAGLSGYVAASENQRALEAFVALETAGEVLDEHGRWQPVDDAYLERVDATVYAEPELPNTRIQGCGWLAEQSERFWARFPGATPPTLIWTTV